MVVADKLMTADQLLRLGDIGRCEIIHGELVMMSPAGASHAMVVSRICRMLGNFVEAKGLGEVFAGEGGFLVEKDPDLLRAPDVAFVRAERLQHPIPAGFLPGTPDIAVEVVSPGDTRRQVEEKVNMWLAHGTAAVWVADPATMTIALHRVGQPSRRFVVGEEFVDNTALPGFTMPVNRVFMLP